MTPTPWQVAGLVLGLVAYAVAWVWGGRPERLAAAVLLFACLFWGATYRWGADGFYLHMAGDCVRLLIFGWLCIRLDRWWPFGITAALALMVFMYFARLLDSTVTQYAVASAHVGLGYLIDLTLLLSVFERGLAGEPPAGAAAWARADWLTATRRNRRDETRPGKMAEICIP
ncbi:hypothetical protein [Brevundimonas sp.]|uniref:hypothetical protein n=1 Tax=Brevundimonas sp. TaxID=1871086 RepID=UPI002D3F0D82|nr:hypothetical protein [Brevundimonas sp.]HYC98637.1 hypothetical protein [Brevundimonas sp.]